MNNNVICDWLVKLFFGAVGAVLAWIEPLQEIMYVVLGAIVLDVITAYVLSRRVAVTYKNVSHGKLQSSRLKSLGKTAIAIYSILLLSYGIDKYCFTMVDLYLPNIMAGAFCMIQFVSCLENISSCNNARWAKILQKILIDKTSRHFDMDAQDFAKEMEDIKIAKETAEKEAMEKAEKSAKTKPSRKKPTTKKQGKDGKVANSKRD